LTAQLQDSTPYDEADLTRPVALVFGTEDRGLTPFWRQRADAHVRIPMAGMMDSLNVSVSAAVLAFEAVRQRKANSQER
ncbi:MAG: RNA methyltransferase, partial [Bacteroidales bacterium]|nr:RNA methyltransferase [Bacteroidales bacterium]